MVKIKIYKPSLRLRGATVARLTPDQKVACSDHVGVNAWILIINMLQYECIWIENKGSFVCGYRQNIQQISSHVATGLYLAYMHWKHVDILCAIFLVRSEISLLIRF